MLHTVKSLTKTSLKKAATRLVNGLTTAVLALSPLATPLLLSTKAYAADTGFLAPTATHTPNDWDVNAVANVQTSNNTYASDNDGNEQGYSSFGISVPAGNSVNGIEVQAEAKSNDAGCRLGVSLSWNNGSNFTARKYNVLTTSDANYTYGGGADNWGRGWTASEFSNANFVLRLEDNDPPGNQCDDSATTSVDRVQVKVYYTPAADFVVTKANNVSGNIVVGNTFIWTITVTNQSGASATFDEENILRDDLPTNADYSPTSNIAITTGGGVTGSIDCDISSDTLDCDNNNGSAVAFPIGGWFSVTITADPDGISTLTNPRSGAGNVCAVDPDNVITESNEANNDCSDTVNVTDTPVTANPALAQSCGLDIALVIDNSTSIDSGELSQMKSAMTAFTAALAGTPTQFSVTKFATDASVVQAFTNDISDVNDAINAIPVGGGFTNWQQGFTKAQTTLPHRSNPNLMIFASDGNPNRTDDPASDVDEATAVSAAKTVANSIKAGGTRILALGIGSDLDTPNLQAISGPVTDNGNVLTSDVITSDFADLAADLATFAQQTCGGTITVQKLIDADGNPNTTNDRTASSNWSFNVGGQANQVTDANGLTPAVTLTAGSGYSVTETQKAGYELMSASCSGATANGSKNGNAVTGITIANTNIVTCTFINKPVGSITLVKNVTNNNGGTKGVNDFGLTIGGTSVTSGQTLSLNAGSYAINEAGASGYQFVSITGTGCPAQLGGNVTIAAGQSVTCTITNDDVAPKLTVIKHVVNDNGGTKAANDFTMGVTGTNVANASFAGAENPGTTTTLNVGSYSVGETGPSGYAADYSTDCSGSISLGQTKVCTVTNDDVAPVLTLIKYVTNNNGGLLQVSDFVLKVDSTTVTSGVPNVFNVGSHTASEVNKPGYTASSWGGDCAANGTITLAIGGNYTCTITNDDQAGTLIVKKVVVNDNGGTKAANDFSFAVNGGGSIAFEVDGQNDLTVNAGVYTVVESSVTGYATSYDNCDQVTVANGETKTCTVTNDDIAPKLTLVKAVTNDNGGNAVVSDFPLFINGNQVTSSSKNTVTSNTQYTATETNLPGYTAGSWTGDCAANGTITLQPGDDKTCTITNDDIAPTITLVKNVVNNNGGAFGANAFGLTIGGVATTSGTTKSVNANASIALNEAGLSGYQFVSITGDAKCPSVLGGTVSLNEGENITCTITNDDIAPKLTVNKETLPSGNEQEFNFTSEELGDFSLIDGGSKTFDGLQAGSYSVAEGQTDGWKLNNIACWGIDAYGKNLQTSSFEVSLKIGADVTCKFTNEKLSAIDGYKFEDINYNGAWDEGEPTLAGWTITITEICPVIEGIQEDEVTPIGNCEDGVEGSTVTDENGYYRFENLNAGNYVVCEELQDGWIQTYPWGEGDCHYIQLGGAGSEEHADFGNFKKGTVEGVKFNDVNGNHQRDESEPTLANWTITLTKKCVVDTETITRIIACEDETWTTVTDANGAYSFANLERGEYTVCETQKLGWTQMYPQTVDGCHQFVIENSSTVITADFGNKSKPQVLGDSTPELVNTGTAATTGLLVGLGLLTGLALTLATRRKQYAK